MTFPRVVQSTINHGGSIYRVSQKRKLKPLDLDHYTASLASWLPVPVTFSYYCTSLTLTKVWVHKDLNPLIFLSGICTLIEHIKSHFNALFFLFLFSFWLEYNCFRGLPGGTEVKNPLPMQETWVQSLGLEDPLAEKTATQYSCLEYFMGRRVWWATVHGVPRTWTEHTRKIALQCCVGFLYTMKWISHMYTYVPCLLYLPPSPLIPPL